MPKANKQIIIDAIIKEIELGTTRGKIVSVFGKKCHVTERTIDRYWKTANQQHKTRQDSIKTTLAALDTQAAIDARKKAIMSADERKEYLTKIVNGQIEVPYTEVKWDSEEKKFKTIKFVEIASHSARISAISELNKMEGDYAPAKTEVKIDAKDLVIDFRKAQ